MAVSAISNNLFLGFGPPLPTLEEAHRAYMWEEFHEDLLNRGESLGRVIDVTKYLLDTVDRPEIPFERHSEFFSRKDVVRKITNLQLSGKICDYIERQFYDRFERDKEARDKGSRNIAANLLRGLKMMKNNEPVFQLPEQDKKDLVDFISFLSIPPSDDLRNYYFYGYP